MIWIERAPIRHAIFISIINSFHFTIMIPFLPIGILLVIAVAVLLGWKLIKFAVKMLIATLFILFIIGVIYLLFF